MIRVLNVGLRGLTLISKFLLIFFLARLLAAEDVGLYGLLAATIGYGIYLAGFEFYNFANRELMVSPSSDWFPQLRDQFYFYLLIYLVCTPLIFFTFWRGWLPWQYFSVFVALLLMEHLAQEFNRVLVALSRQLLASVVLFLRSGFWCLAVIVWMWFDPSLRNLTFTLGAWLIGCLLACLVAGIEIARYRRVATMRPVNWSWIRRGTWAAVPFLLASLSVRGIYTFDRYWVEHVSDLQVLGAYTLYVGMATAVLSFLDAGVVVFFMPRLVQAAKAGELPAFHACMRDFTRNIVLMVCLLSLLCALVSVFVVEWLASPVYGAHVDLLYWLLLAAALYGFSTVPHLGLYAFGHDRPILYAQVVAFVIFGGLSFLLAPLWGVEAVAWSMVTAFLVMFVWKTVAYTHFMRRFE